MVNSRAALRPRESEAGTRLAAPACSCLVEDDVPLLQHGVDGRVSARLQVRVPDCGVFIEAIDVVEIGQREAS